jgi:hypothetical protein
MSIEAMRQALDALDAYSWEQVNAARAALRTAIAEAEKQEPVAWYTDDHLTDRSATTYSKDMVYRWQCKGWPVTPLYTTPPAAQPAPDLLNALKRIVDEPNNTMSDGKALKEIIRIARAAISKATGEQA